jgi:zinc-binding alcohol dehydrogenase family protein
MERLKRMKAIGYQTPGAIDRDDALVDITLDIPVAAGRDLLVEINAISVNPIDTKIRRNVAAADGEWKVLGWDAVGTVVGIGEEVSLFKEGDEVWYAGMINRQGANSEFHLVDEQIVGPKPTSLSISDAAALPLTSVTAWEMLFDRLDIKKPVPGAANAIVIIGGAGGVGSIAIQLVRALTDVTIIATASRPETREWVESMGAHHIIDHSKAIAEQVQALGLGAPAFVFSTTKTDQHLDQIAELIAPQGRFGLIDDSESFNIMAFKQKSVSIHWVSMYTRSLFNTPDIAEQGKILNEVSRLVDTGQVKSTATNLMSPINAENLKAAHTSSETSTTIGKIVLEGFD